MYKKEKFVSVVYGRGFRTRRVPAINDKRKSAYEAYFNTPPTYYYTREPPPYCMALQYSAPRHGRRTRAHARARARRSMRAPCTGNAAKIYRARVFCSGERRNISQLSSCRRTRPQVSAARVVVRSRRRENRVEPIRDTAVISCSISSCARFTTDAHKDEDPRMDHTDRHRRPLNLRVRYLLASVGRRATRPPRLVSPGLAARRPFVRARSALCTVVMRRQNTRLI